MHGLKKFYYIIAEFPNSNVATKRYDNRTATCIGHFSLARAAGLGKYGYGNGIAVTEHISGTVLKNQHNM